MAEQSDIDGGHRPTIAARMTPIAFVLIFSTGFISAKYALPYGGPFTLLWWRCVVVLAVLLPFVFIFVRKPVSGPGFLHSMVSGILIHTVYLGGVFFAISRGMPAGVAALVVAIQPLLTIVIARALLSERMTARQLFWFCLALVGVILIVGPKLEIDANTTGITPLTIGAVALSAFGISLGTVYQKRFVSSMDLRHSTLAQYVGATLAFSVLSFGFDSRVVDWQLPVIAALGWMVFGLSIGSIALLMILIRRGSSASIASLFYLIPAVAAVMAWILFDEVLNPIQIAGGVLIGLSVWMSTARKTASSK